MGCGAGSTGAFLQEEPNRTGHRVMCVKFQREMYGRSEERRVGKECVP